MIVGVVLAGGRSRRFGGGDKCLSGFAGGALLDTVIARFSPQVARLALSANGDPARFAGFRLPVLADPLGGYLGPLAGILAGLEWATAQVPGALWVASVPGDAPFLPRDLVARLAAAAADGHGDAACASSGGRLHPVAGLWSVRLASTLRRALEEDGLRRAEAWAQACRLGVADFPLQPVDPFFNINRPADLADAERLASTVLLG